MSTTFEKMFLFALCGFFIERVMAFLFYLNL